MEIQWMGKWPFQRLFVCDLEWSGKKKVTAWITWELKFFLGKLPVDSAQCSHQNIWNSKSLAVTWIFCVMICHWKRTFPIGQCCSRNMANSAVPGKSLSGKKQIWRKLLPLRCADSARNYTNELIRLIRLMPEEDLYITEQPRTQLTCFLGVDLPFYGSNLPKYGSFGF